MAVLDVGEQEKVPPSLIAFVEAELTGKEDRLVLLERARVDRLLREQALGLSNKRSFGGREAVRAGELWGVDVFCLLSLKDKKLRMQLVDTWYGIRMMDIFLPLPNEKELVDTSKMLVASLLRKLPAVTRDPKGLRVVGILDFNSIEPTNRLDEIAKSLRAAIEQQAIHHPELIVAEREQARPIVEERELVDEFPEGIRASVVLVSGDFHLDEADGSVKVYLQGLRDGYRLFRLEVEGPLHDLNLLGSRTAAAITEAFKSSDTIETFGSTDPIGEMDPWYEAETLVKQARATRDASAALGAMAAAKALVPDDITYHRAYLKEIYLRNTAVPLSLQRFQWYLEECRRDADVWLDDPDFKYRTGMVWPKSYLGWCLQIWEKYDDVPEDLRRDVSGKLLAMFTRCWEKFRENDASHSHTRRQEMLGYQRMFNQIGVSDKDRIFSFYSELSGYADESVLLRMTDELVWPREFSETEEFAANEMFYTWLRDHENPFLRMCGKRGLARIYAQARTEGKYARARSLYEDFEQEFVFDYVPGLGNKDHPPGHNANELPFWIMPFLEERGFNRGGTPAGYYQDEEKNRQYRADHTVKVLRQLYTDSRGPQRINWIWSGMNLRVLEKAERFADQQEILEHCIRYLRYGTMHHRGKNRSTDVSSARDRLSDAENMLRRLLDRHPELRKEPDHETDSPYAAKLLLSFDEIEKRIGLQVLSTYLVLEHGMTAVVGRNGVLFLDPAAFELVRFEPAPEDVHSYRHVAVDDAGIYTVSSKGIAFYPREGSAKAYFRDHPDLKSVTRFCRSMDVLRHRIYITFQDSRSLLEFDLTTGSRNLLVSSKSKVREEVIDHIYDLHYVVADSGRRRIYFCVSQDRDGKVTYHEYMYEPDTKTFTKRTDVKTLGYRYGDMERRGKLILNKGVGALMISSLFEGYPEISKFQGRVHDFDYNHFTLAGDGMLAVNTIGELYYLHGASETMQKIKDRIFPISEGPSPGVMDVGYLPERGLLLLTTRGVYAIPGLAAFIKERDAAGNTKN